MDTQDKIAALVLIFIIITVTTTLIIHHQNSDKMYCAIDKDKEEICFTDNVRFNNFINGKPITWNPNGNPFTLKTINVK